AYAAEDLVQMLANAGMELDRVLFELVSVRELRGRLGCPSPFAYVLPVQQMARCLEWLTRAPGSFDDDDIDDTELLRGFRHDTVGLHFYRLYKSQVSYLRGRTEEAFEHVRAGTRSSSFARSLCTRADYTYWSALICAGM